jgi:hypothetical protein
MRSKSDRTDGEQARTGHRRDGESIEPAMAAGF